MKEEERISHPSFGVINFQRVNGNSGYLFGSEIQPNNFIELSISQAEQISDLTDKKQYPTKELIRVKMSPAQFSELITTLNYGFGTACTIEVIDGKQIEQAKDFENRKMFINRKFKERMMNFAKGLVCSQDRAKKLIAKKTLSKDDQRELNNLIEHCVIEIKSNIPFFIECFQENIDEIVVDAKAEIDSAIQHMITQTGIKAIEKQIINLKKISQ